MLLEVYFDYACPFCKRGYESLLKLLPDFPRVQAEWRPCEAHPRPDRYGLHSDLCARGMYIARAQGADLMEYHRRMYQAAHVDRNNIEDPAVVSGLVKGLVDAAAFRQSLEDGAYLEELAENNRHAWERFRFDAVPSLRAGDATLRAVENVGLSEQGIREFLAKFS